MRKFDEIINMPSDERRRLRLRQWRKARGIPPKKYGKHCHRDYTRQELIDYMRENNVKSSRQLEKSRQLENSRGRDNRKPAVYDYRREFGSWQQALVACWGQYNLVKKPDRPPVDPLYMVKVLQQFDLWDVTKYIAAAKLRPDIIPSYDLVTKHWGGFRNLKIAARMGSAYQTMQDYKKLKSQLGRVPNLGDCKKVGIDLTTLIKTVGTKAVLDSFVNDIERHGHA